MKTPLFTKGQKVTVNCDVHWTDDADQERVTKGPSSGVVIAVDERPDVTIYEIHLDDDQGYFLFEPSADGDVVKAA
jgi:hypothetical protein